jgi:hypothetical protein
MGCTCPNTWLQFLISAMQLPNYVTNIMLFVLECNTSMEAQSHKELIIVSKTEIS